MLYHVFGSTTFAYYSGSLFGRYALEILVPRCYYKSCHVESTGAYEHPCVLIFSCVAVGTVLGTRNYYRAETVVVGPCQDVHHRFGVTFVHRHGVVELCKQLFAMGSVVRFYDECRTDEACHQSQPVVVIA